MLASQWMIGVSKEVQARREELGRAAACHLNECLKEVGFGSWSEEAVTLVSERLVEVLMDGGWI